MNGAAANCVLHWSWQIEKYVMFFTQQNSTSAFDANIKACSVAERAHSSSS